uniref:F-box protein AT5G49610-like beta-propeller domain-containing protein n=1 Tax=Oryza meridionalis TaxID=40149 RepID=A0A0E0C4E1_9ORYZ
MGQVGFTARRSSPPPPPTPSPATEARACGSDPTQPPPPAKRRRTTRRVVGIDSLGEDLLLDILLRLPTLASLVRAALTCRADLHPPPFLGAFGDPDGHDGLPVFLPARRTRDRDRGGDFLLTCLQDPDHDAPLRWRVADCRDGYLLLFNSDAGLVATVNPMAPRMTDLIKTPFRINNSSSNGAVQDESLPISLDVHLISSEEDPMSFQLVWLCHDEFRVQVSVFSNDTRDWCFLPWVDIQERVSSPDVPQDGTKFWLMSGMQANGLIFWPFQNGKHMLVLDTGTMEFSVYEFPIYSKLVQGCSFGVGETKDGIPCIVYVNGATIVVLIRRFDKKQGVQRWRFVDSVNCDDEADQLGINGGLDVVAIKDGFVYLAATGMILSLCLETRKLEKLFPMGFQFPLHPYIMAWPPTLVKSDGDRFLPTLLEHYPKREDSANLPA